MLTPKRPFLNRGSGAVRNPRKVVTLEPTDLESVERLATLWDWNETEVIRHAIRFTAEIEALLRDASFSTKNIQAAIRTQLTFLEMIALFRDPRGDAEDDVPRISLKVIRKAATVERFERVNAGQPSIFSERLRRLRDSVGG